MSGVHDRFSVFHAERFVPAVPAGEIASAAADTLVALEMRVQDAAALQLIQSGRVADAKSLQTFPLFFIPPIIEAMIILEG